MNPCPCGYFGSEDHVCNCTAAEINRYLSKISHPLLDRIDIHVEVSPVKYDKLSNDNVKSESSNEIRKRVVTAREIQRERYKKYNFDCNSDIKENLIGEICSLKNSSRKIMDMAFKKYSFSARTYNKILKVSRTIADLEAHEEIEDSDILEAIRYRAMDSKYWS